jgi:phosphatidylserine/phosphatidylglycerophosphate/cardiolipin synthase-like enzyme
MNHLPILVVLFLLVPASQAQEASPKPQTLPPIEIYFSPKGHCTETIIKEIGAAKTSVRVQAYWFTSAPIAKALVEAHKRGVKVEVNLDRSRTEMNHIQADFLVQSGVPTFIDGKHVTAHSKVIIVDGSVVITGSFNFTGQSEDQNVENMLVIRDRGIAEKYTANWKAHTEHSVKYERIEGK